MKKLKKEVKKLKSLESKLIKMISETDNEKLMNLFSAWQNQRTECNEIYLEFLESINKVEL